jgi:DNA-binding IclR family transcriptional regulator
MPEREARALYADRPPAEREALLSELAAVRERGGALVDGRTLGVALGDPPFAGLALAGDMGSADRGQLEARLREAARAIATEVS